MLGTKYRRAALSAAFVACLALPSFAFAATDETSAAEELSAGEASIVSVDYTFDASSLPNSGRVSVKQEVQGDGYEYKLYPTFDNKDEAIAGIKKDAPKRLALLSESYFLAPMDQGNWSTYYDCMMKFYDDVRCPDWYKESDDEESMLQCFFSLMENDQLNQEIVDDLNRATVAAQSDDADEDNGDPEDVLSALPDQSMLEESLEDDEDGVESSAQVQLASATKAGDFIATSWAKDGKWNHIGFVTAIGSKKNGSYNYQVAQHSKNYVAWTSSKINDWENQGGSDKYLGRIGR